jgi:arylamine N-acetyltransferase
MADMTLDLAGYFERIGYRGAADLTLEVLQDLVTAHTQACRLTTSALRL